MFSFFLFPMILSAFLPFFWRHGICFSLYHFSCLNISLTKRQVILKANVHLHELHQILYIMCNYVSTGVICYIIGLHILETQMRLQQSIFQTPPVSFFRMSNGLSAWSTFHLFILLSIRGFLYLQYNHPNPLVSNA